MKQDFPRCLFVSYSLTSKEWDNALSRIEYEGPSFRILQPVVPPEPISSMNLNDAVITKALALFESKPEACLVEHSSFEVQALGGFPGAFWTVKRTAPKSEYYCEVLRNAANRNVQLTYAIAYVSFEGEGVYVAQSTIYGTLSDEPRGNDYCYHDNIFVPRGSELTLGEMSNEERNRYSVYESTIRNLLAGRTSYFARSEFPQRQASLV